MIQALDFDSIGEIGIKILGTNLRMITIGASFIPSLESKKYLNSKKFL